MSDIKLNDLYSEVKKSSILLVDDEQLVLDSLQMSLKRYFTIYTTNNPLEAISIIKNNDIDLLISDEMMPKMRGCKLVEKIHNEYPDITKIILSGNSDKNDIIKAVNKGHIFSFLLKPIDKNQLMQVVKQGLEHRNMKKKIKLQNLILEKRNKTLINDVLRKTSKMNEMEKFYEIGKFSASIVHNLNTPLQTLITGYQLLEEHINSTPNVHNQMRTILKIINDSLENMEEMIKSITTTARNANLIKKMPVNLNSVIADLIEKFNLNQKIKSEILFITDFEKKLPNISGIKVHFNQIFSNVIKNAIDSLYKSNDKRITIKTFYTNGNVCVSIDDTGCGIPLYDIDKIYETGFTTKKSGKGTGLGLLITKQMVESYKGKISVESKVSKGTSFLICFPTQIEYEK